MSSSPLPSPQRLQEASAAAYAETYAMERQRFSAAEWKKIEPMIFRLLNAHQRQIMVRFLMMEKELGGE